MIKTVIFDLDGTLIDSMGIWAEVDLEFLNKRNILVPDDLFSDMTEGNSFTDLAIYFKNKFDLSESLDEIKEEWTQMVFEHYAQKIPLKPFVLDLIYFLNDKNIPLAIGTSNSDLLTKAVLTKNNILDNFKVLVAGCHNIKGKPNPDIFLSAAEKLNLQPNECLVIEDTLAGVMAAKNADMKVFAVYDKHAQIEHEEIINNADRFFFSIENLFAYLKDNYESLFSE